ASGAVESAIGWGPLCGASKSVKSPSSPASLSGTIATSRDIAEAGGGRGVRRPRGRHRGTRRLRRARLARRALGCAFRRGRRSATTRLGLLVAHERGDARERAYRSPSGGANSGRYFGALA